MANSVPKICILYKTINLKKKSKEKYWFLMVGGEIENYHLAVTKALGPCYSFYLPRNQTRSCQYNV